MNREQPQLPGSASIGSAAWGWTRSRKPCSASTSRRGRACRCWRSTPTTRQAMRRSTALRRAVLARELGHHLHARIYVTPWQCRPVTLVASKVEVQAERWGAEHLLPVDLVQTFGCRRCQIGEEEVAELAEAARVPEACAAWWVRDLEERGMLLPTWFRSPRPDRAVLPSRPRHDPADEACHLVPGPEGSRELTAALGHPTRTGRMFRRQSGGSDRRGTTRDVLRSYVQRLRCLHGRRYSIERCSPNRHAYAGRGVVIRVDQAIRTDREDAAQPAHRVELVWHNYCRGKEEEIAVA